MRFHRLLGSLTLVAAVAAGVFSQTPVQPPKKEALAGNAATAAEFAGAEVVRYDIRYADKEKPRPKFKLVPESVLRWSNPIRGEVHGSVYLWTHDGCPAAIASIYQFFQKAQLNIELVSLSEVPLTGERSVESASCCRSSAACAVAA